MKTFYFHGVSASSNCDGVKIEHDGEGIFIAVKDAHELAQWLLTIEPPKKEEPRPQMTLEQAKATDTRIL